MLLRADASPNPSQVTLYRGATDTRPQPVAVGGWDELISALFATHRVFGWPDAKGKTPVHSPAFSPAEFDGHGREKHNVVRVHFCVLDIDGISQQEFVDTLRKFDGYHAAVYSTFSHGFKPCRHDKSQLGVSARVVLPFTRTVHTNEWDALWLALNNWLGDAADGKSILDGQTKDQSRLYYLPGVREENAPRFAFSVHGTPGREALDVDALIAAGRTLKPKRKEKQADETSVKDLPEINTNNLKDLAGHLKRRRSAALSEIATALEAVVEGRIYAGPGERDAMLLKMCTQIARRYRNADIEKTAALFIPSIEATNNAAGEGDTDSDYAKVVDKLRRVHQKVEEEDEEQRTIEDAQRKFMVREAWASVEDEERDSPYTVDEIQTYRHDLGITRPHETGEDVLAKRWLLVRGKSCYTFVGGKYLKPVSIDDAVHSAARDLAPAYPFGVTTTYVDPKNDKLVTKKFADLLGEYGTIAREIVVDLNAQTTRYDAREQTIYEAPCPLRPIEPRYSHAVDRWLRLLAGDTDEQYKRLRAWVAFASDLSKPCVALYLDGPGGVGKSLFAKALARLWTKRSPTTMTQATALFNDRMVYCPLIFADEKMPRNFLDEGSALVREFVQNTDRDIQRKHLASSPMIGAVRLVMASNNKHMVDTKEMLTEVDIEAITERILYVKAVPEAKQHLMDAFGGKPERIINEDLLAAHSLWLRQNAESQGIVGSGRFLIPLDSSALTQSLTTSSGIRAQICHWLVSYLQSPGKYDAIGAHKVHVRNGELWINAQALSDAWDLYPTNVKNAPTVTQLANGLRGLTLSKKVQARINNSKIDFRVIDTNVLVAWSDETGISNEEEIRNSLLKETVIDGRRAVSSLPAFQRMGAQAPGGAH